MADKTALPTIPLLKGDNYFHWRVKMESVLQLKRLLSAITVDRPVGEDKVKEQAEWDEKNADAVACIRLSLSDEQVLQFATIYNAKQLWNAILDAYTGPAEDRAIDAGEELRNIKMTDDETIGEYISRARGLAIKCNAAGLRISDRQLVYNVVRGLHHRFSQTREILKTQREKRLDEVQEILKEKEGELQKKNTGGNTDSQEKAYMARNRKKKFNDKKKCFVCGKLGHVAKDCYHRKDKQGQTPENRGKHANAGSTGNNSKRTDCVSNQKVDAVNFQTFNVNACPKLKNNDWIIDSGCTSHMTNDKMNFVTFKPINGNVYLAGRHNVIKSKGIGTIKLKVRNNEDMANHVVMHDVVYVPNLRNNLLSVMKLMDHKLEVNFTGHEVKISKKNSSETIAVGGRVNDHFVINMIPWSGDNDNYKCYSAGANNSIINTTAQEKFTGNIDDIWHRRLGHINNDYMQRLVKKNIAIGVSSNIKDVTCDACKTCKLSRKPHKSVLYNQSTQPLELLHMDICGPIPVESLGGARYILLIIDDYSSMYFTYFLKHKNEAFIKFKIFKERYENILGKKIKRIRTDNGTEFINNEFKEYTNRAGIEHQKTVPYNPESNGKVERGNRVLLERARTLLYETNLPLYFWAEAVAYVTHTANLTPRKNKDVTPFELWKGKMPNLKYLRTFGCIAYYHTPKNTRNKLQPSGRKAIMVGYSRERVAYRVYDIEYRQVVEERNVTFEENLKGSYYLNNREVKDKYEGWNIEDLINDINAVDNNDVENDTARDEQDADDDRNIDNENDIINEDNLQLNAGRDRDVNERKVGRPKGSTREEILRRKQEYVRENEERLIKDGVRRSQRLETKHQAQVAESINIHIPRNHHEACKDMNAKYWLEAMEEEIKSLEDNQVWEIVKRPNNVKIVKSKWVFSTKKDKEKSGIKFKARLVAAGYNQIKNIDYKESYSPVISIEAWRTLIAIAAKKGLNVRFFDVKTAYLNSELDETVYLEIPPAFENRFGAENVCKLKRSLYGLPQSGRNWYYRLKEELSQNGFVALASESCIFYKPDEECFFVLGAYVDDLTILDNNSETCDRILSSLRKIFHINETTASKTFLGIQVENDDKGIHLSQSEYIKDLLGRHGMLDCKPVNTPIVPGEDRISDELKEECDINEYQELIGELLYLANRTRPDIAYVTSYLSQYNHCPEKRHYSIGKRVLRYLRGTIDKRLTYDKEFGTLRAYSDASWGNGEKGKSFSGGAIFIGNSLISWRCNKQRTVGNSTCEVELCAIAEVVKDTMWIRNILKELKCEEYFSTPISIYSDNQAAIQWLNNASSSKRTRHVNLKYHFVRDEIERGDFKVLYINTEKMIADSFTKAISREKLDWSCKQMSLSKNE